RTRDRQGTMTPILYSFLQGAKDVQRIKVLVGTMYLFKLVSSLALLSPLYLMLSKSFARNVKASDFLTGLDLSLIIDFIYYWRRTLSVYIVIFILACGAIVLAYVFLSGGFWGVLRDETKKRTQGSKIERFFGYCGKYFWKMVKVALFLGVLYIAALLLFLSISGVLDQVVGEASLWEIASWGVVVRFFIGALLFMLVNMIGDYLRIFSIENDDKRFLTVVGKTFKFLLTNLLTTLGLYYLLSAGLAVVILVFLGLLKIMNTMPGTSLFIFFTFLIQQVFVIFRSFFRLVYYSSQLNLYHRTSGEAGSEHQ
ncbi:MAG: hypothetical protein JSV10_00675, partial [Candidatus Zixiibacteriota bacterium]